MITRDSPVASVHVQRVHPWVLGRSLGHGRGSAGVDSGGPRHLAGTAFGGQYGTHVVKQTGTRETKARKTRENKGGKTYTNQTSPRTHTRLSAIMP